MKKSRVRHLALAARVKTLEDKFLAFQCGAQEQMERDRFAWEKEKLEEERAALEKLRRAFRVRKNAKANLREVPDVLPAKEKRGRRQRANAGGNGG
jgi:hypothetical protein